MQRISRVYLGNCGYSTAWYDGITLDLTNPYTELPTDSIVSLENGGGKTTLMGLIFSCFETSQERFLKHIQSKNNSFSHYFAQDGLPGFIVVEWLMPPRISGGQPYRLITGQVVSIRAAIDPPEVDRTFFSFEERDDLTFKDIPAPSLVPTPVTSMPDFLRWIHEQQKRHGDTVYISRNRQGEWQRHLKEECLIDLDMLQLQVNFSSVEGGFDTGFLNFKTDAEFLRKFLELTGDKTKAEEARNLVITVSDKHRRKPQFQRRRDELKKFRTTLSSFAVAAKEYLVALGSQRARLVQGAQMVQALQGRAKDFREKHRQELGFEKDQREIAGSAAGRSATISKEMTTVEWAWHRKRTALAQLELDNASAAVKASEAKLRHIKAARLRAEIDAVDGRIAELETLIETEREEMKPAMDHAFIQGALLRRALFNEESRLKSELATLATRLEERNTRRGELRGTKTAAEADEQRLRGEQTRLQASEDRYVVRRGAMDADGTFIDVRETTAEALQRFSTLVANLQQQRDTHIASKNLCLGQAKERRKGAEVERLKEQASRGEAGRLTEFLTKGQLEFERLAQLPALTHAVESDRVEVLSPTLPTRLKEVIAESARQMSLSDVRLAEFRATRQAIDATGVAGFSADVAFVVKSLRDAGIRSARAFNEYISRTVPDGAAARALVLSDPARYSGVCVAQVEFDAASHFAWDTQRPVRPVMVSIASLDSATLRDGCMVVGPEDNSAFNVDAAKHLGLNLDARTEEELERRNAYESRHTLSLRALQELETFAKTYGNGLMAEAEAKRSSALEEAETAIARAAQLDEEAEEFDERSRSFEDQANVAELQRVEAGQVAKTVLQFRVEHEAGRSERLNRLADLVDEVAQAQEAKRAAEVSLEEVQSEHETDQGLKLNADHMLGVHAEERGGIRHYDREYPAEKHLLERPQAIETLRTFYKDAKDAFEAEETARLGLMKERIESARMMRESKAKEFTRDFKDVQLPQIKQYLQIEHGPALILEDAVLVNVKRVHGEASVASGIVSKESKTWHNSNRANIGPDIPSLEPLTVEALESRRSSLEAEVNVALDQMRIASAEAEKARDRAAEQLRCAEADEVAEGLLRSSMGLAHAPDPALIAADIAATLGDEVVAIPDAALLVLELNPTPQVGRLLKDYNDLGSGVKKLENTARHSFDAVKAAASQQSFQEIEPEISQQMVQNEFSAASADAARLLVHLDDRIETTEATLNSMQADFDTCIEEVLGVVRSAVSTLNKATSRDMCVPLTAPMIGGKQVLKMRANFGAVSPEARRLAIGNYLDMLAESNVMPQKGTDLIAEAMVRMHGRPLGFQLLKMSVEESEQYVALDRISNSGGEGVVMAMLLYLVINRLRSENQAQVHRSSGGPLLLDNPFAKVTSGAMWRTQRQMAKAMNVQLVFVTAIQDQNAIGEFERIVRLVKAGQNSKTRRWHLSNANLQLERNVTEVEV